MNKKNDEYNRNAPRNVLRISYSCYTDHSSLQYAAHQAITDVNTIH